MNDKSAIIARYETHAQAENCVRTLARFGFDMTRLSILGSGVHSEERPVGFYTTADRMKSWGGVGAFWGSLWGLMVGAAFFWFPVIGPMYAAGPFIHLLAGAVAGALLVGGLSVLGAAIAGLGESPERALKYESEFKADKYIVIAHGAAAEIARAREILYGNDATEREAMAA